MLFIGFLTTSFSSVSLSSATFIDSTDLVYRLSLHHITETWNMSVNGEKTFEKGWNISSGMMQLFTYLHATKLQVFLSCLYLWRTEETLSFPLLLYTRNTYTNIYKYIDLYDQCISYISILCQYRMVEKQGVWFVLIHKQQIIHN